MDDYSKVTDDQRKKEWVKPELEVLPISETEYWKFVKNGNFWKRVWVDES